MVNLKRVKTEQDYAWAMEQLQLSFPECERRDHQLQRQVLNHPHYRLCLICDDANPVGVVGYWDTPNFIYFENFCVAPNLRNCGYGSQTLQLLTALGKTFILEIELPQDQLTKRRLAFYQRNGMVQNPYPHIQPHYRKDDPDLPLMVLSYKRQISQFEYDQFRKYLDDNVDVR